MDRVLAEQALSRVYDYLSAMGVDLTREVTLQALRLVEAGLASEEEDPLPHIMTQVREKFPFPYSDRSYFDLPPIAPEIFRGSMGYKAP